MAKFFRGIKQLFATRPYLTNAVVYGTLFSGAECSQQFFSRKVLSDVAQPMDVDSIKRYAIFGTCIQGPLLTAWYRWLDRAVLGSSYKIIARKVLMDQFLMTPHLVWLFFIGMSIMERKDDILAECKQKYVQTYMTSCMFWLPAQTVNFLLIPSNFRVVYVGTCSLVWVNILCYLKNQKSAS